MSVNYHKGQLHIDAVPLVELAQHYQTPLYIYSSTDIINNYQQFNNFFGEQEHLICYAVKANSNLAVLNELSKQGCGFDVVSQGELAKVLRAGGRAEMCIFSGVGKTKTEISYALTQGVMCFNIESESELYRIDTIAKQLHQVAAIAVRVNPDVDAKTHPYIATGLTENKFGVSPEIALKLYQYAKRSQHLKIKGIDCHIGSQITRTKPFLDALDKVLDLVQLLAQQDIFLDHIDLGGGFGVDYKTSANVFDIKAYIEVILTKAKNYKIILEPGRAVVANAGVLLTKVEFLKQSSNKNFAVVDAAMNDLLRPALYGAYHQILPVIKAKGRTTLNWDVVGGVCESGDFLAKDRKLSLQEGDLLAVLAVGAYGSAMSSNYNSRLRPAEVMVSGSKHRLIKKRESLEDLFTDESI